MEFVYDFNKEKNEFRSFFPFCKKARESLDVQLEKFVYTKTHLAKKRRVVLRVLKNNCKSLILLMMRDLYRVLLLKGKKYLDNRFSVCIYFTHVLKLRVAILRIQIESLYSFYSRSEIACSYFTHLNRKFVFILHIVGKCVQFRMLLSTKACIYFTHVQKLRVVILLILVESLHSIDVMLEILCSFFTQLNRKFTSILPKVGNGV
ncbi:Uncharacterised protein [Chryseobacterium gleum]|uniref:Uncharacterized protein n=2 Tax=Chryseobacterium gleum TaxID=250 RepID=A0A3S4N2L5_CHRGE|nr:hypothetical protein CEQ15_09315 [Chryseobacterium indologenes]EFK33856.1 hypothetical protein HMPREF0204_12925 [Chryseobacterium gleum ATCC 35910]VEE06225.1 Uncharacterised protein [Chryseobacterium gleum]